MYVCIQPSLLFIGYWIVSPMVRGLRRLANHSTPSGAGGKNVWSCTSGLTECLHGRDS